MAEKWKPVVLGGYQWPYEVSDLGRVRRSTDGPRTHAGRVLRPWLDERGYPRVNLRDCARRRTTTVHRVVAEAFLGPPPSGMQVNHIDGNKQNARLNNFEYVTASENQYHAVALGLKTTKGLHGERNPSAKLTEGAVREIRRRALAGENQRGIARAFGISPAAITLIKQGRRWAMAGAA